MALGGSVELTAARGRREKDKDKDADDMEDDPAARDAVTESRAGAPGVECQLSSVQLSAVASLALRVKDVRLAGAGAGVIAASRACQSSDDPEQRGYVRLLSALVRRAVRRSRRLWSRGLFAPQEQLGVTEENLKKRLEVRAAHSLRSAGDGSGGRRTNQ
jgi:hypothetical protein